MVVVSQHRGKAAAPSAFAALDLPAFSALLMPCLSGSRHRWGGNDAITYSNATLCTGVWVLDCRASTGGYVTLLAG